MATFIYHLFYSLIMIHLETENGEFVLRFHDIDGITINDDTNEIEFVAYGQTIATLKGNININLNDSE